VINARIDLFLRAENEQAVLTEAIERASAYLAAGADCVYPILVRSPGVLAEFVEAVSPSAVNAVYQPDGPGIAELGKLGVARISLGAGLWRATRSWLASFLADLS
jgi:2-methylisocitrate lyase-like PEP mutase family enzyme